MTSSNPIDSLRGHSIRVVVADDHALVLEGLRSMLTHEPDIRVIATASDGERLLDAIQRFTPDVVLVDLRMPYMDGLACLEEIRRRHPQTRVLLITAFDDPQTMHEVLAAGPDGLLLKCDPPDQVAYAIRQVMNGQLVFPGPHANGCAPPPVLPPRSSYLPASWTSSPLSPKASATAKSRATCTSAPTR